MTLFDEMLEESSLIWMNEREDGQIRSIRRERVWLMIHELVGIPAPKPPREIGAQAKPLPDYRMRQANDHTLDFDDE